MTKKLWTAFGLAAMFLLSSGSGASAQREPIIAANTSPSPAPHTAQSGASHATPSERNPRYQICRQDVLLLSFPLSPELNQKVTVQPDGYISLESTGSIFVAGLTLDGVVAAIKKAYAGVLHDPIVNVDLTDFQKPLFTVWGQVGKPGQYDLRQDITITQAIAIAGGLASSAKTQVFLYRAVSANWAEVRELKLKDIMRGKNASEDLQVRAGDMIFVPEAFISKFKKYVPYNVGLTTAYASF